MDKTLVLIKPDGVQRGLIGEIISRIERRGLKIIALKMTQMARTLAETHYGAHKDKPFFAGLVNFITSSPIIAMVLEGREAVKNIRSLMGETDPLNSPPGTIRGDFALDIGNNLIHGSDSNETAQSEIKLFFSCEEIISYKRDLDKWIIES